MLVVFHRYFCGIPSVLQALKNHADTGLISLQYYTVEYWEKTSGVFPMYFQLVIKLRDYYCGISSVFHGDKLEEYAARTEGKPKGFSSVLQTAWTLRKWMWFPPSLWHIFWVKIRMRGSRLQSAYSWTKYVAPPVVYGAVRLVLLDRKGGPSTVQTQAARSNIRWNNFKCGMAHRYATMKR